MIQLDIVPFSGFPFWLVLTLFVLVYRLSQLWGNRQLLRNLYMIFVSCIVIVPVLDNHHFISFLFFLSVLVYFVGKFLFSNSSPNSKKINIALISIIVFILCYFKYSYFQSSANSFLSIFWSSYQWLETTETHIFFVGISYFSFKFIHFLVDCYKKRIKNLNLFTFINYTLFFPSFFSGPINRYNSFAKNIHDKKKVTFSTNYIDGIKRIINGLFKKLVLANNLLPYTVSALDFSDPSVTPAKAILGIYAYMFYIYFDFSGYTDMAIGSARLVGIDLPENFNYPFLKRNLQQFWANWHMSLTTWLTDYIYWPAVRKMRHITKLRKRPVSTSNICIIVTFMVCGLWHGDGLNFFLWGLYHGIGLAILNGFTFIERRYFPLNVKIFINKTRIGYTISAFITFQYVAFGFLLFACDMKEIKAFFETFF